MYILCKLHFSFLFFKIAEDASKVKNCEVKQDK